MSGLASLVIASGFLAAAPGGNHWHHDYGAALEAAKEAERPLLVVLEVPTDPARRVAPAHFTLDPTQTALLANYELCRIDVRTGYGKRVAQAFRASEVPHTAIIDRTGSYVLYRNDGRISTDDWVATLVSHRTGKRVRPQPQICFT